MMRALLFCLALFAAGTLSAQDNLADRLAGERQQQTGTAITIIFDDSGSMNADQKLPQAKAAFTSWLRNIPDDTKLSLITFNGGGRVLVPLGANNRENVSQSVSRIVANSGTPICQALRLALQQITERRERVTPYERHVVLLFTDGQETSDSRGINGVREEIGKLREANIEVAGVGFHGQGDYMDGVATHYYSASDEVSLASGLAKIDAEIGDTNDIVVSPEELTAMKQGITAPPKHEDTPAPLEIAQPAPRKKFSAVGIFFVVLAVIILRGFFRKKR